MNTDLEAFVSDQQAADRRFMEAEEARERTDEERNEKRKKEARSRLPVETGAGKFTSKAESNSYAGFQYVIVHVPATVSEIIRGHSAPASL